VLTGPTEPNSLPRHSQQHICVCCCGNRAHHASAGSARLRLVATALPLAASLLELATLGTNVRLAVRVRHTCVCNAQKPSLQSILQMRKQNINMPSKQSAAVKNLPLAKMERQWLFHSVLTLGCSQPNHATACDTPGARPKCLHASREVFLPRSSRQSLPVGRSRANWSKVRHSPPACTNCMQQGVLRTIMDDRSHHGRRKCASNTNVEHTGIPVCPCNDVSTGLF